MRKQFLSKHKKEQILFLQSKIDNIRNAADNKKSAVAREIVNEIRGKKKPHKSRLKVRNQDEQLNLWQKHFKKLLGKELKEHQLLRSCP